jgi:O-antigen/teichoic acid export membrane protein
MFWRGVMGYLPVNIVQGVVGLLTIVVFTRVLSPADYGVYALAFSATSLVSTGLFVWLEAAMARFYASEAVADRLPGHFATIYRTFGIMAVGFPLLAGAILWLIPMQPALRSAFAAGLAAIMIRSLLKLAQERRRAAGEVSGAAIIDMLQTRCWPSSAGGAARR